MRLTAILLLVLSAFAGVAQTGLTWIENFEQKKIELRFNDRLLTAYCFFDSTEKPILFPIKTVTGVTVTRGFPVSPRVGERTDHPHQVGLWFTYESVNGLDFWNNSHAVPQEMKHLYGSIRHQKILSHKAGGNKAALKTLSHWVDSKGAVLLEEIAAFHFQVDGNDLIVDRESTLTSKVTEVTFMDVKDGLLGIRVARELEMPSTQADKFVDAQGNQTITPVMDNTGVTGVYVNKQGIQGDEAWGKRSEWMYLSGIKDGEKIAIVIIDHPANPGYPTYWHARGYGLFAANPLGQTIFSNGNEKLNFKLQKDGAATFRYRIIIHSGSELNSRTVDRWMASFHDGR